MALPILGRLLAAGVLVLSGLAAGSCDRGDPARRTVLLNRGSDTMINVAQAWAEEYARVAPGVSVEVAGGGSGVEPNGVEGQGRPRRSLHQPNDYASFRRAQNWVRPQSRS